MEEAFKTLNISPKILTRRSNAMWHILLTTEQEARQLAGSVLTTKNVRLQTEYMSTRATKITVHGYPMDSNGDLLFEIL